MGSRRRLVAWSALLVSLAVSLSGNRATHGENDSNRRLIGLIPLPSTEVRWPQDVRSVTLAGLQEEVYAVVATPPAVWVLAPDGGLLRTLGHGILQSPQGVAVAYPVDVMQERPDPRTARLFVIDSGRKGVVSLTETGQEVSFVAGFDGASAIAGTSTGVVVADTTGRRLVFIDYDGRVEGTIDYTSSGYPFEAPAFLASTRDMVLVADIGNDELAWFGLSGRLITVVPLQYEGRRLKSSSIALESPENVGVASSIAVLVATDRGLFRVKNGPQAGASVIEPVLLDNSDDDPLVILSSPASHWRCISGCGPMPIYGISQSGHWYRWYATGEARLTEACPFVGEKSGVPVRVVTDAAGQLLVLYDDGTLVSVSPDAKSEVLGAVGAIDDLSLHKGAVAVLRAGVIRTLDLRPGQLMVSPTAEYPWGWPYQPDCPVIGGAVLPSLGITENRAYVVVPGWFKSRSNFTVEFAATSLMKRFFPLDGLWSAGLPAGWGWMFGESDRPPPPPRLITDIAVLDADSVAVVDRLAGRVYRFNPETETFVDVVRRGWSIPGRPWRVSSNAAGRLFVLTAEGSVWEVAGDGRITSGWDAAGAVNARRSELVDIAVSDAYIYVLDMAGSQILVYAMDSGGRSDVADVLPRCTLVDNKVAQPRVAHLNSEVSVALRIVGDCAKKAVDSDIVLLIDPPSPGATWTQRAVDLMADQLLSAIDWQHDRVAVLKYDAAAEVVAGFGTSRDEVADKLRGMTSGRGIDTDSRPLRAAGDYVKRYGREEAESVVITIAHNPYIGAPINGPSGSYRFRLDAAQLRQSGVRVITITDSVLGAFVGASAAYELEDFHVAPDDETLRAIYNRLGAEYSAYWLARQLIVVDRVPDNMTYLVGSASPPAQWDVANRTLTWSTGHVPFSGFSATYRIVPTRIGSWPTNVDATATFVDGYGQAGTLTFPVPWIDVVVPPTATPTSQASPTTVPTPTASPTPRTEHTSVRQCCYLPIINRQRCEPSTQSSDIALVIDASSSMGELGSDSRSKIQAAKDAATAFVEAVQLGGGNQIAVVTFDSAAELEQELTDSRRGLDAAVAGISLGSGSRLDLGIQAAKNELGGFGHRPGNRRIMIVLTDGMATQDTLSRAVAAAEGAKAEGVSIFAVGFGTRINQGGLLALVSRRDYYFESSRNEDLRAIYLAIASEIPCR